MKKVLALVLAAASSMAMAEDLIKKGSQPKHPIGLGVILGAPTRTAGRFSLSDNNSMHAYIEFIGKTLNTGLDFVWRFPAPAFVAPKFRPAFHPYVGGGVIVASFIDDAGLGFRVPFGVAWLPPELAQIEFFFEMAPGIVFFGDHQLGAWGTFDIALGAIYYF